VCLQEVTVKAKKKGKKSQEKKTPKVGRGGGDRVGQASSKGAECKQVPKQKKRGTGDRKKENCCNSKTVHTSRLQQKSGGKGGG